ncbi:PAS domain-containing protein [Endothiovibrio diazotrophicus]
MKDIEPADVEGDFRQHELTFHDGSTRKVCVVDEELPFPEGYLIVSRTDTRGIITHANKSFVAMSGYTMEELIGEPHHILRHPDMPKAGFQSLWETIESGKKWHGYVKNLRKDGRFYWVYATVVPNVRHGKVVGYTSVRRRPSRKKVAEAEALYRTLMP